MIIGMQIFSMAIYFKTFLIGIRNNERQRRRAVDITMIARCSLLYGLSLLLCIPTVGR